MQGTLSAVRAVGAVASHPSSVADLHAIVCLVPRQLIAPAVGGRGSRQYLADPRQRQYTEIPGRTLGQVVTGGPVIVAQQPVLAAASLETDGHAGGAEPLLQLAELGPQRVPGGYGAPDRDLTPLLQKGRISGPEAA